jgi:hypothetical protein
MKIKICRNLAGMRLAFIQFWQRMMTSLTASNQNLRRKNALRVMRGAGPVDT